MLSGLLLSLLLVVAPAADARVLRIPPLDQCAADPSFAAFRDALRAAVARRDRDHVLSVINEATIVDYGGGVGRADFIAAWGLDGPGESPVWRELEQVLALGCARDLDGSFWAPSLAIQLADQDDVFTAALALPGAVLRATPEADGEALATLEWDVLTLQPDDGQDDWLPVALADGRGGWLRRDEVRALLDRRAVFERIDGRWVLAAFVAGD